MCLLREPTGLQLSHPRCVLMPHMTLAAVVMAACVTAVAPAAAAAVETDASATSQAVDEGSADAIVNVVNDDSVEAAAVDVNDGVAEAVAAEPAAIVGSPLDAAPAQEGQEAAVIATDNTTPAADCETSTATGPTTSPATAEVVTADSTSADSITADSESTPADSTTAESATGGSGSATAGSASPIQAADVDVIAALASRRGSAFRRPAADGISKASQREQHDVTGNTSTSSNSTSPTPSPTTTTAASVRRPVVAAPSPTNRRLAAIQGTTAMPTTGLPTTTSVAMAIESGVSTAAVKKAEAAKRATPESRSSPQSAGNDAANDSDNAAVEKAVVFDEADTAASSASVSASSSPLPTADVDSGRSSAVSMHNDSESSSVNDSVAGAAPCESETITSAALAAPAPKSSPVPEGNADAVGTTDSFAPAASGTTTPAAEAAGPQWDVDTILTSGLILEGVMTKKGPGAFTPAKGRFFRLDSGVIECFAERGGKMLGSFELTGSSRVTTGTGYWFTVLLSSGTRPLEVEADNNAMRTQWVTAIGLTIDAQRVVDKYAMIKHLNISYSSDHRVVDDVIRYIDAVDTSYVFNMLSKGESETAE